MNRTGICYTHCCVETQTMATNIPCFQSIKGCTKYLSIYPHKHILYPSNSYNVSNVIRLAWSGDQCEDYTTQNCFECHQYVDHAINLNRRQLVSAIIHTLLRVVTHSRRFTAVLLQCT